MSVSFIVAHCSATPPGADIGAAEIDEWHKKRGWKGIGYNYVIRRDGRLEQGRKEGDGLAHAEGYNFNSIAVCMVGGVSDHNVPKANFEPAQWVSLRTVIDFLLLKYPSAKLLGHRDLPGVLKDCPSFDARHWYATRAIIDERKRL